MIALGAFAQPNFVLSEDDVVVGDDVVEEIVDEESLEEGVAESAEEARLREEIDIINQQIEDKRKNVQKLEKSIATVKKDINKTRLKKVSFQNQIAILDNRTTQVELDVEVTQEKIDTLDLEIKSFALQIEKKEENISNQKEMIAEFIRTIHYEDDKSYLEILAAYDNFSDFYNRLQYLQTVQGDLGKSAKSLRLAKADLEEKKGQTEARQDVYKKLKDELSEKKEDLSEQKFLKSDLLDQTKSSERTFQTLLENLRKQYQEIEAEIAQFEKEVRNRLAADDKLKNTVDKGYDGKFSWPTQSRYVTARFHDPDYPYRHIFEHNAIDIRAAQGTPVKAASSGYVARAKRCSSWKCYSYIMLVHSGGISTVYGHMSRISVSEDQFVTRGDVVGYSGGQPYTPGAGSYVTGPHLHFEIRKSGIPVNPLNYLIRDWE